MYSTVDAEPDRGRFYAVLQSGVIGEAHLDTKAWLQFCDYHSQLVGERNLSFHVMSGDQLLATVAAWKVDDRLAHFHHSPIPVLIRPGSDGQKRRLHDFILQQLLARAVAHNCENIDIFDYPESDLFRSQYASGRISMLSFAQATIDLSRPLSEIQDGFRTSYRSHINWCRANLTPVVYRGSQIEAVSAEKLLAIYADFLQKTIAQNGNSMPRWLLDSYLGRVREEQAELILFCAPGGRIVGMLIIADFDNMSYYALAAATDVGNKMTGPFMVSFAIERAQARGQTHFVVDRHFDMNAQQRSRHERNLHYYKLGFVDRLEKRQAIRLRVQT